MRAKKKITVDIIIPSYGQEEYSINCFKSIKKFTKDFDYRIIWVDNGSSTDSRFKVINELKTHKRYLTIWADDKLGFVKATNEGLKYSIDSDFIVLLNNDTVVHKDWLKKLTSPFKKDPSIGITGPNTTRDTSRQSWNLETNPYRHLMPKELYDISSNIPKVEKILDTTFKDNYYDFPMIAFFCGVISRKCFNEIGLLGTEFGDGYSDDTDYCNRTLEKGYRICYVPGAYVTHFNRTTFSTIYTLDEIRAMMKKNQEKIKLKQS